MSKPTKRQDPKSIRRRHSKEAKTTRIEKVIGNVLDAETRIILSKNVQTHQETRPKKHSSKVLGAIEVRKMMKRRKTKRVSWLMHLARLENKVSKLKEKLSKLERNKEVDLECTTCQTLKIDNEKLKEEALKLTQFQKSTHSLNEMLSLQKPSGDKSGLGFNSFEASTSGTKKTEFVKSQNETSSGGGPLITDGGPRKVQMDPKANQGLSICLGIDLEPDEWIKDSRCSKHMTGIRKLFSTHKAYNEAKLLRMERSYVEVLGKARLYVMKLGKEPKDKICLTTIVENSTLWHRRLVHVNMRLIQSLVSKELVMNLPKLRYLKLLHMDLFGPSTVRSYGENLYTLVMVDDYSRTLQEMGRTMLNEQSLPQKFCSVDTSTYILNRILIRAIVGKTPYELLRGRKPTLDYFKVFRSKCFILNTKEYLIKFDPKSYEDVFLGYSQNSKAYIILNKHTMKIEESLNVTFDETPPLFKTSPLVDDGLNEEKSIKVTENKNLENDIEDETLEVDEIVNIKEFKNHPLGNVIGNLNKRTLSSQAQNQSNFFSFISTMEPNNVNEALKDES
nr:retrovirus-related Pol polyprotein from transposon TNT 1-94 [Tanacetum cinerariifolium]